jgi:hypothetical protein
MKLSSSPESFTPYVFFKAFLPLAFLLSCLEAMNVAVAVAMPMKSCGGQRIP